MCLRACRAAAAGSSRKAARPDLREHPHASALLEPTGLADSVHEATAPHELEEIGAREVAVPTDRLVRTLSVEQHLHPALVCEPHHGPLGVRRGRGHRHVLRSDQRVHVLHEPLRRRGGVPRLEAARASALQLDVAALIEGRIVVDRRERRQECIAELDAAWDAIKLESRPPLRHVPTRTSDRMCSRTRLGEPVPVLLDPFLEAPAERLAPLFRDVVIPLSGDREIASVDVEIAACGYRLDVLEERSLAVIVASPGQEPHDLRRRAAGTAGQGASTALISDAKTNESPDRAVVQRLDAEPVARQRQPTRSDDRGSQTPTCRGTARRTPAPTGRRPPERRRYRRTA